MTRTTPSPAKAADPEFQDFVIDGVNRSGDHYLMSFGAYLYAIPDAGVEPHRGDTLRIYGDVEGDIRGADVNGEEIFYRTEAEQQAHDAAQRAAASADAETAWQRQQARLDAEYAALPPVLQAEMDVIRAEPVAERAQFEATLLFTVQEALKIATAISSPARIRALYESGALFSAVPGLHSGHTDASLATAASVAHRHVVRIRSELGLGSPGARAQHLAGG